MPVPISQDALTPLPSKVQLLNDCRALLHETFVQKQEWQPDEACHITFHTETDTKTTEPVKKQLCDRFDRANCL